MKPSSYLWILKKTKWFCDIDYSFKLQQEYLLCSSPTKSVIFDVILSNTKKFAFPPLLLSFCFFQVKIKNWVNGIEGTSVVGLSARFGTSLPRHVSEAFKTPTVFANPFNCCTDSTIEVLSSFHLNVCVCVCVCVLLSKVKMQFLSSLSLHLLQCFLSPCDCNFMIFFCLKTVKGHSVGHFFYISIAYCFDLLCT